jgi:hypothetical protein
MEHNSTFPIKQNELDVLRDEATDYIKSIQWEQSNKAEIKKEKMIQFYCIYQELIMEVM